MNNYKIVTYPFDKSTKSALMSVDKGSDWPVVYILHNDKNLYVGETSSFSNRLDQHLKNPKRKGLKDVEVIYDDEFNKSAILDIEQSLIQLFSADKKYKLQNENSGQSKKHNYYQREKYLNKVDDIWTKLGNKGLTKHEIDDLRNSNLFKYSPYNTLTDEQYEVSKDIIYDMMEKLDKGEEGTSIISGGAGTGKTIVLINILTKIINSPKISIDFSEEDDDLNDSVQMIHDIQKFYKKHGQLKIAYVVPMNSMRKTMATILKENNLKINNKSIIRGPLDITKEKYDIVFVDESHRLSQYKNIGYRGAYREAANRVNLDYEKNTELDFIIKNSKYRVLVYDGGQTVKGSDITHEQFEKAVKPSKPTEYTLLTQLRCKGGKLYTSYLRDIFNCTQNECLEMNNYDFKMFDDVNDMVLSIKNLDTKYGLCRNAAGYSWKWVSKSIKNYEDVVLKGKEDININGYKYVWNMVNQEFIISKNAVNEIGCIHTLQGYDLNYAGIIFGKEIDYNPKTNSIEVDLDNFYDTNVKIGNSYQQVREYIINSYKVMMTRGIKGCYVYACNPNLRKYLSKFIKMEKHIK